MLIFIVGLLSSCQKQINYAPDISGLNEKVAFLQKRTDSLSNALNATNIYVININKSIDSIKVQISSISLQISTLTSQLNIANANITSINTQINLLSVQLSDLLDKLNALINQLNLPPSTLNSGLIAFYPFTGNAVDSSGNGNNGSIINTISYTTDRNNLPNAALQLGNGRVVVNNEMFKFNYTDKFSISFWFQDSGSETGRLLSTENPEGNFRIASYGNGVYAFAFGGMPYLYDTVAKNTWNHISYVYSNRTINFYKNGTLKSTTSHFTNESLNYGTPFTIGSKAANAFDNWKGKIDELRIYNRVLNTLEIDYLVKQ